LNEARKFHPISLDAVNFLLADVRGALGPYLNVFLVTQQQWSQSNVGLVTMISGLLGIAFQTPIGAAIDATRAKRAVVVVALGVLALGAGTIYALPTLWPVMIANSLMAIVGDVFGPAVAALTLGLYARKQLARRMGRNSSTMPAMSPSRWRRRRSARCFPSAPCSCWFRFSPCWRVLLSCRYRPPRLTMTRRATWRRAGRKAPPGLAYFSPRVRW
jgi:hypothetical protein